MSVHPLMVDLRREEGEQREKESSHWGEGLSFLDRSYIISSMKHGYLIS